MAINCSRMFALIVRVAHAIVYHRDSLVFQTAPNPRHGVAIVVILGEPFKS